MSQRPTSSSNGSPSDSYVVGISYARPNILTAKRVADVLAKALGGREHVFFDNYHPTRAISGYSDDEFHEIYVEKCSYVVPIFSKRYREGTTAQVEWRCIQKIIHKNGVFPIQLDDTIMDGWSSNRLTVHRSGKQRTAKLLAETILDILKNRGVTIESGSKVPKNPVASDGATQVSAIRPADSVADEKQVIRGCFVVADVSDFSGYPDTTLTEVINQLWGIPRELGMLSDAHQVEANGLLDGVVLAFRSIEPSTLLDLCEKWIKLFAIRTKKLNSEENRELRLAIHAGTCYLIDDRKLLVGADLNECSRLVRQARPGQIVVSRDFVDDWKKEVGENKLKNLHPKWEERPFGRQIKPRAISYFRLYKLKLNSKSLPPDLSKAHIVEQLIFQVLEEIEDEFFDMVYDQLGLSRQKLRPRVSVFLPDPMDDQPKILKPTGFRFSRYVKRPGSISDDIGKTIYECGSAGQRGPVGVAFDTNKTQVLVDLPGYKRIADKAEYEKLMKASPWNLDEQTVRKFSQWAQSYVAIPFRINDEENLASGVVCVDCMSPLSGIDVDLLEDFGDLVERFFGKQLAAYLLLRS